MEKLHNCVSSARHAWRVGLPITADVYMRHALGHANALKDARLRAGVMRIRNKMRPAVNRAYSAIINEISN